MLSSTTFNFQGKVANFLNPSSKIADEFIIPQVSLHDEISTYGHDKAVIELTELVGMLIKYFKNKIIWTLHPEWEKKKMNLCLNRLSLDRTQKFQSKLIK